MDDFYFIFLRLNDEMFNLNLKMKFIDYLVYDIVLFGLKFVVDFCCILLK